MGYWVGRTFNASLPLPLLSHTEASLSFHAISSFEPLLLQALPFTRMKTLACDALLTIPVGS